MKFLPQMNLTPIQIWTQSDIGILNFTGLGMLFKGLYSNYDFNITNASLCLPLAQG